MSYFIDKSNICNNYSTYLKKFFKHTKKQKICKLPNMLLYNTKFSTLNTNKALFFKYLKLWFNIPIEKLFIFQTRLKVGLFCLV